MTPDLIQMAREAGIGFQENTGITGKKTVTTYGSQPIEKIELLIKLVRNATLEEAAQICDRFQARDVGMQPAECAGAIRNLKDKT